MKFDVLHPKWCMCDQCVQQKSDCFDEMMERVGYTTTIKLVEKILSHPKFATMAAMGEDEICEGEGESFVDFAEHGRRHNVVFSVEKAVYELVQNGEPDDAEELLPHLSVALCLMMEHLQMLCLINDVPSPKEVQ